MFDKNTQGRWLVLICKMRNTVIEPITTNRLFNYVKIDSKMTVFCTENTEDTEYMENTENGQVHISRLK